MHLGAARLNAQPPPNGQCGTEGITGINGTTKERGVPGRGRSTVSRISRSSEGDERQPAWDHVRGNLNLSGHHEEIYNCGSTLVK